MSRRPCRSLLEHAERHTVPAAWREAEPRVAADAAALDALLRGPASPAVYGVTTLVGHLDDRRLPPEEMARFQEELLRNHALGSAPYYPECEAACVGYCKAHFYSLGGSAVSPELFRRLRAAVADVAFRPRIPQSCSYSCGDVIPAAHWGLDLLQYLRREKPYRLRPKEGLSLINGCFVEAGVALARLPEVQSTWLAYLVAGRMNARLCRANRSDYSPLLATDNADPIRVVSALVRDEAAGEREEGRQDPVSVRAFPQVAAALAEAVTGYLDALDQTLSRRSDNPLVLHEAPEPLSQASFLAPRLALAAGQLIEAWLLALWSAERRLHWLLSGRVPGVPLNGSPDEGGLGFIQVPKLATAVLEETRLLAGRRTFASGSSTSYGIEDLWSFGLETLNVLTGVLRNARRLLAIEIVTTASCAGGRFPEVLSLLRRRRSLARQFEAMAEAIDACRLPIEPATYPFDA
jgi:histidine ammonia-lyase